MDKHIATQLMEKAFGEIDRVTEEAAKQLDAALDAGVITQDFADLEQDRLIASSIGLRFYSEANRSLQAGAYFAAVAIAASSLEAVLLARCISEREKVKLLPKWHQIKKKYKENFRLFVHSLDLGKLLEIASLLGWFPKGMPKQFESVMTLFGNEELSEFIESLFIGSMDIGEVCAKHVKEYRNLLHPAVCLKERHFPSEEAGKLGVLLHMIALTSLTEKVS